MAESYNLILKSEFSESEKVLSFVEKISMEEQLCEDLQERLKLAVSEAATNAIVHGNREDLQKKVAIRINVDQYRVLVEVQDEGDGFSPHEIPDPVDSDNLLRPGGRGIFLIREYCDGVRFADRGRCVILRFEREKKD